MVIIAVKVRVLSKPTAAAGIIITQHFVIRLKANELPKRHLIVKSLFSQTIKELQRLESVLTYR